MAREPFAVYDSLDQITTYLEQARRELAEGDTKRAEHDLDSVVTFARTAKELMQWANGGGEQAQAPGPPNSDFKLAVLDTLKDIGKPVPLKGLFAELQARAVPIPGQGKPANLIAHLRRWPEVSRPKYGVYTLSKGNGRRK